MGDHQVTSTGLGRLAVLAAAAVLAASAIPARGGPKRQPTKEELAGWPVDAPDFKPVEPGEHPRLLFRKGDVAALRKRAETPEGRRIVRRLRLLLNGSDGETMCKKFGVKGPVTSDGSGPFANDPPGTYTISHTAGYGMLYVLTGDKKYADLGRESMDKAFEGYRDRDRRYSFKAPYGALRSGPSLGWTAMGYDLCYDGWDEAYRKKVALALANYNEGRNMSLDELTRGERQHPGSNHWGMQVGGAAMALLAIMNDPDVDMAKIGPLLETSQRSMVINMTQGFGDGGFFAEGDGTGSMSSHIVFLPALQAWRTAAGKDFYNPKPNAQWMALKWFFLTVPPAKVASWKDIQNAFPRRGAYAHNIWSRNDKSGGGYFSIAFGVAGEAQKAAILWFYNRSLKAVDDKDETPFDTPSPYPHHAILSFVNWPFGLAEKDPDEVIPHAYRDTVWKFYAWRKGWQDENDIVLSILTHASRGNMGARGENKLTVQAFGKSTTWGAINGGFKGDFEPKPDGSTVLTTGDGLGLAIDFSGASGADAMLVMTGPMPPGRNVVEAGGTTFTFHFLTRGNPPTPEAKGDKVVVGGQTVSFDGKKIVLAK